jgi:hypothetical protein
LYSALYKIGVEKSGKMKWAGLVARVKEMWIAYIFKLENLKRRKD